jgi:arylsulfatase A-like enzyme
MTRHSALKPILILALGIIFLQCSIGKKTRPKYVILITLDTLRADHVSAYDTQKSKTPNIDYFAEHGFLVENCFSSIPITAPAHASLFYSQPPHILSLYNNGQVFQPEEKIESLAELFQKKGYATAGFVSLGVLQSHFQLHNGFDLYDDDMPSHRWYLNAQEINQKALPWIEKNKEDGFFAWIHYSDPHDPYAPPTLSPDLRIELNGQKVDQLNLQKYEQLDLKFDLQKGTNKIHFTVLNPYPGAEDQFRAALNEIEFIHHPESLKLSFSNIHFIQREDKRSALIKKEGSISIDCLVPKAELIIRARGNLNLHSSEKKRYYREEVEYLDFQLGILTKKLKEWNLLDKSLIVLVGDHGEGLGEDKTRIGDRYFGHIHFLYRDYMRVPLIIYDPNTPKSTNPMNGLSSIMDVTPTILGRMDWAKKAYHQGRDLFKEKNPPSSLLEETYTPEAIYDRFGMLQFPWHMIYTPETQKVELYDLISDPAERNDVFEIHKNTEDFMGLQQRLRQKASDILESKLEVKIDKESLEMLKSLGYIK